jgi:hypothetical protein
MTLKFLIPEYQGNMIFIPGKKNHLVAGPLLLVTLRHPDRRTVTKIYYIKQKAHSQLEQVRTANLDHLEKYKIANGLGCWSKHKVHRQTHKSKKSYPDT